MSEFRLDYATLKADADLARSRLSSFRRHAEALRNKASRLLGQASELSLRADRESLWLDHLEALLQAERDQHHAELAKPKPAKDRCPAPCGKQRHANKDSARRANRTNGHRMRVYYSTECRCWHITKGVKGK
jgi:hypothetical protein